MNNTKRNELFSRRVTIFLHIQKVGGSSFWHSLSSQIYEQRLHQIAVRDAHHESFIKFGSAEKSLESLISIKNEFKLTTAERLFVHYHILPRNLVDILPNCLFLIMLRSPIERMRSGFRHWRAGYPQSDAMDFFSNGTSKGINYYLAGISSYFLAPTDPPPLFFIEWVKNNCFFFTLDDYINQNSNLIDFYNFMNISTPPILHHPETITDHNISVELDLLLNNDWTFTNEWNRRCSAEIIWHNSLNLKT